MTAKEQETLHQLGSDAAVETKPTVCFWCKAECGLLAQVKGGRLLKLNRKIIDAEHGWWYPEMPGTEPSLHGAFESNINVCMSDDPDHCNPEIGSYPLRTALCRISKAEPLTPCFFAGHPV